MGQVRLAKRGGHLWTDVVAKSCLQLTPGYLAEASNGGYTGWILCLWFKIRCNFAADRYWRWFWWLRIKLALGRIYLYLLLLIGRSVRGLCKTGTYRWLPWPLVLGLPHKFAFINFRHVTNVTKGFVARYSIRNYNIAQVILCWVIFFFQRKERHYKDLRIRNKTKKPSVWFGHFTWHKSWWGMYLLFCGV